MVTNQTASLAANDIRDIKPPIEISDDLTWLWWALAIIGVMVAALALWRWWQRKKSFVPAVPMVHAHIRAKQKLEEALALIAQPKPFVIAVSDTVRTYLEERFTFRAPERTTEEFLRELGGTDLLTGEQKESLGGFLESCDLVKFAKYEPRESELRELHGAAVKLVEETEPADPKSGVPSLKSNSIMTFAHSYLLLLLLLLPLAAWLKGRRGSPPAFLYSSVKLVEGLTNIRRSRAGFFLAALRWLTLAIFIVALAQPRLSKSTTTVKASGVDIVVALDLSGSMLSEDYDFVQGKGGVSRFNMARSVLKKFIDQRPSDRIGLVVFASQAYIGTPLTLDHEFLQENLDRLEIGVIGQNSTAIGDGLGTAVNRLRDVKSKSKIVILMTDGQNNSGKLDPLVAAEAAASLKVKVYTVGIGKQGLAPMPVGRNPYTGQKVYQDVPVDVDEDTLQKIADKTGGKYYRADNAEKFRQIYAEIDKLEKTEAVINKYTEFKELFTWLVAGGLALLLMEVALGQTVFRRLP